MSSIGDSNPVVRVCSLLDFRPISRSFVTALQKHRTAGQDLPSLLQSCLQIKCVECGIAVSTEEFLALAGYGPPLDSSSSGNSKVGRLRLGYCARQGCPSRFYQVTLQPHPEFAWEAILAQAAESGSSKTDAEPAIAAADSIAEPTRRRMQTMKVLAGLVIVLVLWGARRWTQGERIPFIREPAKFKFESGSEHGTNGCSRPDCPYCAHRRALAGGRPVETNQVETENLPSEIVVPDK
jgi:hypothetical protein